MSYKKIITITLVAVLLCASLSVVVGGRNVETKEIHTLTALKNSFSSFINRIISQFPILGALFQNFKRAKPPEQHTPETPEEPEVLVFEISMKDTRFTVEDDIVVTATLTNIGKRPLYVSEMCCQVETLDFLIRTKDGLIHYIGPYIDRTPRLVLIEPEQSITCDLTINSDDVTFGKVLDSPSSVDAAPRPYKFDIGEYVIWGKYVSKAPVAPSQVSSDIVIWNGELESNKIHFTIMEQH